MRIGFLAAIAVLSAWPAFASPDAVVRESVAVCDPINPLLCLRPNAAGGLPGSGGSGSGSTGWGGTSTPGVYHNYAVTTQSAQILPAAVRTFLDLSGQNASIEIWCNFTSGQAAVINPATGNDSFRIAAGGDARWENSFAPADAVSCIAAQNTTLWAGAH